MKNTYPKNVEPLRATSHAAKTLGVSVNWISELCLKHSIGRKVGNYWVLTDPEIELLAKSRKPIGRPKKIRPHD